ncbi:uncharacterized protein LOC126891783 [Diabrotica virgifera virgifera]|uniref:MADF domain-containing protein n=1 Tax=Diabrotica virgifera virgifera TaxID=50390 RepID=A0ABM5L3I6_DIAVI|nr:uncharacterized protein LOC126891783 [Diabrotica virgifera virgifera]
MDWGKKDVFKFLQLYEDESVIWNPEHSDNKNRNLVYDAWKRIEINMDGKYPIDELKRKKESLMASYRGCRNKIRESTKSGSGTDDVYKPSWLYYEKMAGFLLNRNKAKVTMKSEAEDPWTTMDDQSSGEENDPIEITPEDLNEMDELFEIEELPPGELPAPELPPSTTKSYFKPPVQKKMKMPEEDDLERKSDEKFAIIHNYAQKKEKQKDYCDKYGEVVAERLRQLDERTRDVAINRIDNLLFELKVNPTTSAQFEIDIPTDQN